MGVTVVNSASVASVCFQYSVNLFFINFQIENPCGVGTGVAAQWLGEFAALVTVPV